MIKIANLEGGNFDKFVVINRKFLSFLCITDQIRLNNMLCKLNKRMKWEEKKYKYLVINTDESYADEVIEILKRNSHWG